MSTVLKETVHTEIKSRKSLFYTMETADILVHFELVSLFTLPFVQCPVIGHTHNFDLVYHKCHTETHNTWSGMQ